MTFFHSSHREAEAWAEKKGLWQSLSSLQISRFAGSFKIFHPSQLTDCHAIARNDDIKEQKRRSFRLVLLLGALGF